MFIMDMISDDVLVALHIKYKPRYKCIHPTYHGSEVYSMIHPKVKQPRTQRVYDSAVTNTNVCRSMNEETIITTAIVQKL